MSWEETGNAGTNPDTNFLGTTDEQPVVIRTNNSEALRVDSTGKVGIGTPGPADSLHVSKPGPGGISIQSPTQAGIHFMAANGSRGLVLGRSLHSNDTLLCGPSRTMSRFSAETIRTVSRHTGATYRTVNWIW